MEIQPHAAGAGLTPTALLDILARLQDCLERETDSLVQPGAPDLDRIVVEKGPLSGGIDILRPGRGCVCHPAGCRRP